MTRSLGTLQLPAAGRPFEPLDRPDIFQKILRFIPKKASNLRHFSLLADYSGPDYDIHIDFDTNKYLNIFVQKIPYLVLELNISELEMEMFSYLQFSPFSCPQLEHLHFFKITRNKTQI